MLEQIKDHNLAVKATMEALRANHQLTPLAEFPAYARATEKGADLRRRAEQLRKAIDAIPPGESQLTMQARAMLEGRDDEHFDDPAKLRQELRVVEAAIKLNQDAMQAATDEARRETSRELVDYHRRLVGDIVTAANALRDACRAERLFLDALTANGTQPTSPISEHPLLVQSKIEHWLHARGDYPVTS